MPYRTISRSAKEKIIPQMAQKIQNFNRMNYIGSTASSAILTRFSRDRCYSLTSNLIMELPQHHMHERIKRTWASRTDPLWWSCVTMPDVGTKHRVIRSHLARRLKMSFVESLRKAGYAKDGTRLPGSDKGTDLVCSMQISPRPAMLQMRDEELRGQTDELVKMIQDHIVKKTFPKAKVKGWKKESDQAGGVKEKPAKVTIRRIK